MPPPNINFNSPQEFAVGLCTAMGWPVTQSNLVAIVAWCLEEGGHWNNSARFNPLNTTENWPGASSMNSVGVKSYANWVDGLAAVTTTLKNGRYGDILAAFQGGNAQKDLVNAGAGLTTWSGGGYANLQNLFLTAANNMNNVPGTYQGASSGGGGFTGNVQQGSANGSVRQIQAIVGAAQDGVFGPQTRNAVITWQRAHGLAADGVVGPKTWAAMFPGGGSGAGAPSGAPPAAPAADVNQMVQDKYGYMAWALAVPELKGVLDRAATEGWSQDRLQSALQATGWWQQHSSVARQWVQLQSTDPATAQRELQQKLTTIQLAAQRLGIDIPAERINQMATDALTLGWSDTELNLSIVAEANFNSIEQKIQSGQGGGNIASIMAQLKAQGAQYYIPMSDQATYDWTIRMLKDGGDPNSPTGNQGYTAYLQEQAKGKYPYLTSQIDQGITPATYFQPYKSQAAQLLEVAPDKIDMMNDPKYTAMANFWENGTRRAMTLTEAGTYIRGLPDWGGTQNANTDVGKAALGILQSFGAVR